MFAKIFTRLERLVDPIVAASETPPTGLLAFFRAQIRQVEGPLAFVFAMSMLDALFDTLIPYFIGRLVTLMGAFPRGEAGGAAFFAENWPILALMAVVVLIVRPLIFLTGFGFGKLAIEPGWQSRLRWQYYSRIASQSLSFFQSDFAGRLANRVMQTGGGVRMATMACLQAVVYIIFYVIGSFSLIIAQDWRLALPIAGWIVLYLMILRAFLPEQRRRAQISSAGRSILLGKIVDSFGNIQTLKLFGEKQREDAYISAAVREANAQFQDQQRLHWGLSTCLSLLSAVTLSATCGIGLWLWSIGAIEVGVFAMAAAAVFSLVRASGWIAWEIAGIMENVGVVQEGIESIAKPLTMLDRPQAVPLKVTKGEIRFDKVTFAYDPARPVLHDIRFTIRPGEKVGLVGRSGAGKSTIVQVLLRFHELQSGRILIDDQDIAGVSQESLRKAIAVVAQDTSLLHRSIRDNIAYGRPDASEAEIHAAAEEARAADFIPGLSDWLGRTGYDAHVGERGVKLSGGQRQRVALARVILKGAPILVLDEATSALDSEAEAAIQANLAELMGNKTVIAIAHRLSTLLRMDRLIVLDAGRIIEEGTHASLLAQGGLYADLWSRQSGGFLLPPKIAAAVEPEALAG